MKTIKLFISLAIVLVLCSCQQNQQTGKKVTYAMAIHGGAGFGKKANMTEEEAAEYTKVLTAVLEKGKSILESGGSSLDAVEAAVMMMEDSPLFNAGKGAVFTELGENELDASIMEGKTLNAGAVAGVKKIRNPIAAARKVMTDSKHVMLIAEGAEKFATEQGLELADSSYFFTEARWESLQRARSAGERKTGTVGAVALDMDGNLAAATSTGGMTNKMTGRIGDSPIIGAGTYADNGTCAVSGTGHGEFFIRNAVAYDISARMKYLGETVEKASIEVINKLKSLNANGGVIAIDKNGNVAMPFNTLSMIRGYVDSEGELQVYLLEE